MTIDDRDVVAWYGAQHLSDETLARVSRPRRTPWLARWLVAACVLGALGGGALTVALTSDPDGRVATTPRQWTAATPIPDGGRPPRGLQDFQLPEGMVRTGIELQNSKVMWQFLNPGNYVDVLYVEEHDGQARASTLYQAMLVIGLRPKIGTEPAHVELLTTPEQRERLRLAESKGSLVASLRNDLDVGVAAISGVDVRALQGRLAPGWSRASLGALSPFRRPAELGLHEAWSTHRRERSTFALDVDTASFSVARDHVRKRWLPPPEQVRLEEFVNAQPYDLPAPEPGEVFGVELELVPSPWTEGFHLLRIGLGTEPVEPDARSPLHLTFLVDNSCSMAGQLGLVDETLGALANELRAGDTVALVRFADDAELLVGPLGGDVEPLRRALRDLKPGGGTGLQEGLELAYAVAEQRLDSPGAHRVVLCTDGMPNLGLTDGRDLADHVSPWVARGIGLTSLGFGRNGYRDEMMEAFADASDGNYAYIDSVAWARHVLVDRLTENLVVVARDAKAQISWDAGVVSAWRQLGYRDRQLHDDEFRDDAVDAGEIGPGHQVTALYEVRLTGKAGALGSLTLRSEPPGAEGQAAQEQHVPLDVAAQPWEQASGDTRVAAGAASVALILGEDPLAEGSSLDRAWWMIADAGRTEWQSEDEALMAFVAGAVEARRPPEPVARGECVQVELIRGAEMRRIWVDQDGNPCE